MPITIEGTIQVTDEQEQVHNIHGDDFNIDDPEVNEGGMGEQRLYLATYENEDAEFSITIQITEYPVDAYDSHEVSVDGWHDHTKSATDFCTT